MKYRIANKTRGRIKVSSLFFIDKVDNYVSYKENERVRNGKFAKMFEEEYLKVFDEIYNKTTNSEEFEVSLFW